MKHLSILSLLLAGLLGAQEPVTETVPPLVTETSTTQPPAVRQTRTGETVLSPRIRDITHLGNCMPHMLTGIGLVTGLPNTGSTDRGTRQAILNFIKKHNLNLTIADVVGGTTALVAVTCRMPPFAKEGQMLDVEIAVISDASSLRTGNLLPTELIGIDGQVHVVAEGRLSVAGYVVQGQNASAAKNPNASGWLQNGGLVIRENPSSFYSESGALELLVANPSPFNAASIAKGAATALAGTQARVSAVDSTMVRIELPEEQRTPENALQILNQVGIVRVPVENPAKVVIDQTSGTVIAGEGVLISPCVVGITELTIAIAEDQFVSQPNAFSDGTTERVNRTTIEAEERSSDFTPLAGGATVSDLLQNLRTLGLTPGQTIQVFQHLNRCGFLHATLEVR